MATDVQPYEISISDSRIQDLKERLARAQFPDSLDGAAWDYGAPMSDVRRLADFWTNGYDWKTAEKTLNETLPHFHTRIRCEDPDFEELGIHFLHQKSSVRNAIPLLFVHGWPGCFLEATKILGPLTTPGPDQPAFHVVAPSLPNFGFSEGTRKRGFSVEQHAQTLHKLMLKLGYTEYVAQGGDWGWYISRTLSYLYPDHCKATHLNMDVADKPTYSSHPLLAIQHDLLPYTERERRGVDRRTWFQEQGFGYNLLQSTKPQTLAYALSDSPLALLAWVYEKLHDWTDNYPWTDDEVCTWVSIYWFSTAGPAASCRIYYEIAHERPAETGNGTLGRKLTRDALKTWQPKVKIGLSHFPRDINVLPSTWTRTLGNVVFEQEHDSGGHFAAWEKPDGLVADLRAMFARNRGGAYAVVKDRTGYD